MVITLFTYNFGLTERGMQKEVHIKDWWYYSSNSLFKFRNSSHCLTSHCHYALQQNIKLWNTMKVRIII